MRDAETYMAELTAVLMQYPPGVGYPACDAARRRSPDFVPSVGAIQVEAEKLWAHRREALTWAQTWDRRAKLQLRERREEEERRAQEPPEHRREVVRRVLGYVPGEQQPVDGAAREAAIEAHCLKYGITRAQFDALPDARPGDFEKLQRAAAQAAKAR